MNGQRNMTSELKVGQKVIVTDHWTETEIHGWVTGLTDGGFYWVDDEDAEVFWINYNDDWKVADERT